MIEDFDSGTDAGTYFVSIMTSNPDSCMNQVLEQTLNANALPEAGGDNTAALCNDGTTVNLADYLVAPYTKVVMGRGNYYWRCYRKHICYERPGRRQLPV